MNIVRVKRRISYLEGRAELLEAALDALIKGGVKSYAIDDRNLTRFDIPALEEELQTVYDKLDELESIVKGGSARKAVGCVPRDW